MTGGKDKHKFGSGAFETERKERKNFTAWSNGNKNVQHSLQIQ